MKQIQATVLAAAVTLSLLCLGAASPFSSSKQDLENRLSFLEQQNTQTREQLEDLSRRVDILAARVNDLYGGPAASPSPGGAARTAPSSPAAPRASRSTPASVPNLEVVRVSPEPGAQKRKPGGKVYVEKSEDSTTVIEEAQPGPLPGTNYIPPPDPADSPSPTMAAPAPAAPAKPAVESSKDEKQAYTKIKELWDGGQKDAAVPLMEDYVKQFPRGAHLDEVAYKLGRHRYEAGNYALAIESFRTVTEKFPGSSYGADAQYLIGECYLELGQEDKAGDAFREVLVLYPFSNAASKAEEKLGTCCK